MRRVPAAISITSIDLRIQYLAYRELKAAVQEHGAKAGTVIVLDIETGEVLAMVNQPAYNPNDRDQVAAVALSQSRGHRHLRAGLEHQAVRRRRRGSRPGRYHGNTIIDTSPGFVQVGIKRIPDHHNLGPVTLTTVLAKSSNVGMTKMAMTLPPKSMYDTLTAFGFGAGRGQRLSRASRRVCSTTTRTGARSARRPSLMDTACR